MSRTDRQLSEFVAEAEEILEGADRDLDAAETALRAGKKPKPDTVNRLFRHLHSLKGLAGMVGATRISDLSHDLEDALDKVRLGKLPFDLNTSALLVEALALLKRLVRETSEKGEPQADIQPMIQRIHSLAKGQGGAAAGDWKSTITLEPEVLSTLSEYEEFRLKENVENRVPLFSVVVSYGFDDFDVRLRALTDAVGQEGEVVSTLPVVGGGAADKITFRLLIAHEGGEAAVRALTDESGARLEPLLKGASAGGAPKPVAKATPKAAAAQAPAVIPAAAGIDAPAGDGEGGGSTVTNVRVDITKLDSVMGLIGEIALVKARLAAITKDLGAGDATRPEAVALGRATRDLERKLNELQKSVVDIRMVPVGQIFQRLARFARRLAPDLDKHIDVHLYGEETELDKAMVEAVSSPLMHVIRNSIDHGIEPQEVRILAGKAAVGVLKLSAFQRGNSVVLRVSDDGRGIDRARVRARAIERGLVPESAELNEDEIHELLFMPGFSTAEEVSEISGRGVGLDVVRKAITDLKGQIAVESEPGKGTTFEITLPITLAIIQSLVVRVAGRSLVIPLSAVAETLRLRVREISTLDRHEVIDLRGRSLPLIWIEDFFKYDGGSAREPGRRVFVVVVKVAEKMCGLVVDAISGQQEVVIKPIGRMLAGLPGVAGASELGQGEPVLVVDVASMIGGGTVSYGAKRQAS